MTSILTKFALNGQPTEQNVFQLDLRYTPAKTQKHDNSTYTCIRFRINTDDSEDVEIPSLAGWHYTYSDAIDSANQVFGIDHKIFENLTNSRGEVISQEIVYHIYNTFIDFHSFCNVLAEPTQSGKGIQDLRQIGQKIVHVAAFSEPPTHLGSNFAEGSFFKNGKITLSFKGLSSIHGSPCGLIGFDSGKSSFKMIMTPVPKMNIVTVGSSHYQGDLYIDLQTRWVKLVTLHEYIISETSLPMPPNHLNSIVERNIIIENVNQTGL
jgi:hypothetical protein